MEYSIIIIDDSADYRALLQRQIQRNCSKCRVETYDPVSQGKPDSNFGWSKYDVALLDYHLGEENGLDWLAEFNSLPGFPPVIFMTGEGSERIAARAIKFGAEDYLPKSAIDDQTIMEAIKNAAHAWDAKPSARDEKKKFLEVLEGARTNTGSCHPALFFMEVDQWSTILESEGPRFLARVINDATEIIRNMSKRMALDCHIFNYSDHEMAFVLPDSADKVHCREIGETICQEVVESQFEYTNQTVTCTCSVGITLITKQDSGVRDIIKKADAACRAARIRGGNTYYVFPNVRKKSKVRTAIKRPSSTGLPTSNKPLSDEQTASSQLLATLGETAKNILAKRVVDPADLTITNFLDADRKTIKYTGYAPIFDNQDSAQMENLFHITVHCQDYAGNEVNDLRVMKAARANAKDIDLDLYISRFALNQAHQFRNQHNQKVVFFCTMASISLRRLEFLQRLHLTLEKMPKKLTENILVFRISIKDYISQPKEFIDTLTKLQKNSSVRFCITGIKDESSLRLCRHHKLFDFVELSTSIFIHTDDNMVERVAGVLNNTSIKLIIDDINSPEELMRTLMFAPDYIGGDFVARESEDIELFDITMTHIEL